MATEDDYKQDQQNADNWYAQAQKQDAGNKPKLKQDEAVHKQWVDADQSKINHIEATQKWFKEQADQYAEFNGGQRSSFWDTMSRNAEHLDDATPMGQDLINGADAIKWAMFAQVFSPAGMEEGASMQVAAHIGGSGARDCIACTAEALAEHLGIKLDPKKIEALRSFLNQNDVTSIGRSKTLIEGATGLTAGEGARVGTAEAGHYAVFAPTQDGMHAFYMRVEADGTKTFMDRQTGEPISPEQVSKMWDAVQFNK